MKLVIVSALVASAASFSPAAQYSRTTALNQHIGAGGMADTRNPDAVVHEDPRKSISAAPSFEEYLKQRAAAAAAAEPSAPASARSAPTQAIAAPSSISVSASASSAISAMAASQSAILSNIASSIPDLAPKPDLSYDASSGLSVNGRAVTLDARDAPGPANIAWISSLNIDDALSSLTIYNGPLTDVPHLISRCAVVGESMHFFLDFRPRAYGAYDLRNADGTYPGPETLGRKSFEYSGARRDFDTKFGNEEVVGFLEGVVEKLEGGVERRGEDMTSLSELERVTRGPLALDLVVPLTENNINTIIAARESAANYWLSWALDSSHAHRPGAPINSQYVYDTKYKQNAYGALLDVYCGLYGQVDGEKLAAADSGPLDEAYVGGGS